jgi:hypothetical protein
MTDRNGRLARQMVIEQLTTGSHEHNHFNISQMAQSNPRIDTWIGHSML